MNRTINSVMAAGFVLGGWLLLGAAASAIGASCGGHNYADAWNMFWASVAAVTVSTFIAAVTSQ